MKIAYLGPEGTFTQEALNHIIATHPSCLRYASEPTHEGSGIEFIPESTQQSVIAAVARGEVDFGCVPIESTLAGSVAPTLDGLLENPQIIIYAETIIPIRFVLAVHPSFSLAEAGINNYLSITEVSIYPVACQQIHHWLHAHLSHARIQFPSSNAHAGAQVAQKEVLAAITTFAAAEKYQLQIVEENIIDDPRAETRFIFFGKKPQNISPHTQVSHETFTFPSPTGQDRTSIAFDVINTPGSLALAIAELSLRGIDLIRLESRPKREDCQYNTYWFFADLQGHILQTEVQQALMAMKYRCSQLYFFGSWPLAKPTGQPPRPMYHEREWLQRIIGS